MKIICVGRNYTDHIKELDNKKPKDPVLFLKPQTAIINKGQPFFIPSFSEEIHYELEVIIKINRLGRFIEKKFSHRKYSFFKYNFKNSKSYKKYILDLRSRITGELVTQLNKIHKTKYSEKLWKILLEPWLTMYLENNYYRWDLIR